jgi:hypothetical protein
MGGMIVEGVTSGGLFRQRCESDEQADRLIADIEAVATLDIEWTVTMDDDSEIDAITGHRS